LDFAQGTVARLLLAADGASGVVTVDGRRFDGGAIVVTAGTFLRGRIHLGLDTQIPAGRAGDAASLELAEALEGHGFTVSRFKTGTPPRIDGRSVDYSRLSRQDGESRPFWFSFHEHAQHPAQLPCWLTRSDGRLREIIARHIQHSALYGGAISGRGPRYCPSIEDKIVKFPDAQSHQVFLEPEGLDTSEMYVNGLSTSLPPQVQLEFLQSVPGLESVRMTRPGYAIEYDYFPPTQLRPTLESRVLPRLFFAGQVNGTTGYEEAAGQGVVAGLNAAACALGRDEVILSRDSSMIGVLVDDLVNRGVDEPYRLFTSRAEFRLLLRQDNALRRLLPLATRLGLLTSEEQDAAQLRLEREDAVMAAADTALVEPIQASPYLAAAGTSPIAARARVSDLARRPNVSLAGLLAAAGTDVADDEAEWADIELKYSGYLTRERAAAQRLGEMDGFRLPVDLEYESLNTLSFEARQKLAELRPASLGQAGRVPGVSPSDLQSLVMEVLKLRRGE
jgi:tRNA uridine 5-carboxymethylaminomethyl modification enzyme